MRIHLSPEARAALARYRAIDHELARLRSKERALKDEKKDLSGVICKSDSWVEVN